MYFKRYSVMNYRFNFCFIDYYFFFVCREVGWATEEGEIRRFCPYCKKRLCFVRKNIHHLQIHRKALNFYWQKQTKGIMAYTNLLAKVVTIIVYK